MDFANDSTYYICLIGSAHDMDKQQFGDYLFPVYMSLESLIENHPGLPYITITQKK